jgi:hypothetical protein
MIKLKDLLKESSPGFANRKFGDPLPTLKSIAEKHQKKEEQLNEGIDLQSHVVLVKSQLDRFKNDLNAKRGGSFDTDSYEYEDDRWNNDSKMLKARDKALKKWSDKSIKVLMTIIKDYEKAWRAK